MESRELVKNLRQRAEINPHQGLLLEAADKIEWLQKLVDDMTNDHFVDTLDFYSERCQKLEEDFAELVMKSPNICSYCKNNIECKGKEFILLDAGSKVCQGCKYGCSHQCCDSQKIKCLNTLYHN